MNDWLRFLVGLHCRIQQLQESSGKPVGLLLRSGPKISEVARQILIMTAEFFLCLPQIQTRHSVKLRTRPAFQKLLSSISFNGRLVYSTRNHRFVPHALTEVQRRDRVEKSTALLSVLTKAKRRAWQFIITGDESWFCYYTSHSKIWLPTDADAPEVAKQLINPAKIMVTIFWNPYGIHVLSALPEKTSFDAGYFIDNGLSPIEEFPVMQAAATKKQTLIVHMENSPIHKSKAAIQKIASVRVKIAPHPPYSPDLAPPDFFLFVHIKQKIAGQEFLSADDLLEAIREEFDHL
jgi:histone-lysine N-methyltransferase SETMAR